MSLEDEKRIMFEIYRDAADSGRYHVVYFTELGEHEREMEISRAANGEHLFDGYILSRERWEAKQAVGRILDQLNNGTAMDPTSIETELKPFMG
jgi:hypothetical protein